MNDEYTIDMLIQKILTDDKQYDLSKIITAYEFASKAHEGQRRSSGQPYIIHPLAVSYILLELGMDTDTICAAMLHDVVEDTHTTLEEVKKTLWAGCRNACRRRNQAESGSHVQQRGAAGGKRQKNDACNVAGYTSNYNKACRQAS